MAEQSQIFFILVMFVAECMFLPQAWPQIGWFTKLTATVAVLLPYIFLYLACAADPGYITKENLAYHLSLYPYDWALFHPGRICRTCNIIKPPRSKHCNVCKRCIARSDHHCIFVNSCVGYGNHHWFLLLLFFTAVLTSYGGILGLSLVSAHLKRYHPAWSLWCPKNMSWTRYWSVWGLGIRGNVAIGASTLLAGLISPLVWGLFWYTVYLIYAGTTTNESLKWSEFKEDIQDGYAFARPLPSDRPRERYGELGWTRWPAESETIMVTTNDQMPPRPEQNVPGIGEWETVRSMKDVTNLYDLGLLDNLRDVFFENPFEGSGGDEPFTERERRVARNRSMYPP